MDIKFKTNLASVKVFAACDLKNLLSQLLSSILAHVPKSPFGELLEEVDPCKFFVCGHKPKTKELLELFLFLLLLLYTICFISSLKEIKVKKNSPWPGIEAESFSSLAEHFIH